MPFTSEELPAAKSPIMRNPKARSILKNRQQPETTSCRQRGWGVRVCVCRRCGALMYWSTQEGRICTWGMGDHAFKRSTY
eukprot:6351021-Pyramimonas_sp.AAC.1